MPPYVPRKRLSSEDPPAAKRHHATPSIAAVVEDTDTESSLSDVPDETPQPPNDGKKTPNESDGESSDSDEVDWEDAIESKPTSATPMPSILTHEHQDLELTLDKNEIHLTDLLEGKKGPSKIERQIRIQTHCLHVQFLLHHNAIRNIWANDPKLHDILRRKLRPAIHEEVKKWRIASGLEAPEKPPEKKSKKGKGKQRRQSERDWAEASSHLEPGKPDMSSGDPIITLLKILAAYWKGQFKVTAPGLRKHGYRPMAQLEAQITSFKDDNNPEQHGERIADIEEFRHAAEHMQGSRDVGAQLFTALLRALNIEARLVASLQPLGFGWTKSETYTPSSKADTEPSTTKNAETEDAMDQASDSSENAKSTPSRYDTDLPFPIYWTEAASPITNQIIPVDPLVLRNSVATTPELQAAFEPRGGKADKAKQVICYVIAYSLDKTAKDVTTRYLRRRTWPSKTKGYRMPIDKIPIPGRKGKFIEYDWFRVILRPYERSPPHRTAIDTLEDANDLLPNQPDRKPAKEGDTLQSLRTSTEFVLERFLRREEALKPNAQPVRTFTSGKGAKSKTENIFRRKDVLKCQSAESWHKEGRQIQPGQTPLKHVPIRAVTLLRKREVDEYERENGQKPKQGLYAKHQTEYIIPPPIRDGVIPKNDYGNIDCFVPSMVPRGATHIPWPGTVRVCKKLGVDYAEAVTGFEFGSKMAVPVIQGVVVAAENEDVVKDAWRADEAEKRKKEQRKAEAKILQTWRKFLFGLRIAQRVREEYGGGDAEEDAQRDAHNPFTSRQTRGRGNVERIDDQDHDHDRDRDQDEGPEDRGGGFLLDSDSAADQGGGFLLPGEDDGEEDHTADQGGGFLLPGEDGEEDEGLAVDHGHDRRPQRHGPGSASASASASRPVVLDTEDEDEDEDEPDEIDTPADEGNQEAISLSSASESLSPPVEIPDSEDSPVYEPPPTRTTRMSTRRRTRGGGG
ncbi:Rad4-domain-containing protein [Aspergillus heteromorphus CBS 117.55]|uniref:Rad4-domain-containing protein n=1 Tax=Aspergillus heteromorphus CBS 117.55 TaxID=1448321 RepID=A0A317VJY8_9EURO|nr:Rad4-domain-containing protein [Aspergillus heteromorphus CBS 117.55]PWY73561.1 Rad4-domain-containing protein [Aspergillus heteromorphus CBS 117.55]